LICNELLSKKKIDPAAMKGGQGMQRHLTVWLLLVAMMGNAMIANAMEGNAPQNVFGDASDSDNEDEIMQWSYHLNRRDCGPPPQCPTWISLTNSFARSERMIVEPWFVNPIVAWALRVIGFEDVSAFLERMNGVDPIEFLHSQLRWLQLNWGNYKALWNFGRFGIFFKCMWECRSRNDIVY